MLQSISATSLKGIPFESPHAKPKGFAFPKVSSGNSLHGKDVVSLDFGIDSEDSRKPAEPALAEPGQFQLDGHTLKGHLAGDVHHSQYPSSRYEIRTYMPVQGGQAAVVDFRDLLQSASLPVYPSERFAVKQEQIDKAVRSTGEERQAQISDIRTLHDGKRVVPKDSSLNPDDISMFLRSSTDVSTRYVEQLSQIGQIEGFHMIAGVQSGSAKEFDSFLKKAGYANISLLEVPHGEVWTEDYGEPTLGGGRVVPAIIDDNWGSFIKNAISEGREQRYAGTGLDGAFAYHGAVNQGKFQQLALAQGLAAQTSLRQSLSYLEGGNIFTGSLPNGEGYVLVGADSFQVTRKLLEQQTGHAWEEADVRKVIGADLGLKPENVHPIEQPGAFHLDMRMTAVAPGEIMLNDSVAAAEQEISWMRDDLNKLGLSGKDLARRERDLESKAAAIREHAQLMVRYENLTERDLKAAGLTVHRVGGSFVDQSNPNRDTANYFNARHGTNEQGQRFTILMGGNSREEAYMAQKVFDASGGTISRIHFLDPSVTQSTLDLMGGLKCRTKPGGDLISQESLQHPQHAELVSV